MQTKLEIKQRVRAAETALSDIADVLAIAPNSKNARDFRRVKKQLDEARDELKQLRARVRANRRAKKVLNERPSKHDYFSQAKTR